jgi:hypothetical protein
MAMAGCHSWKTLSVVRGIYIVSTERRHAPSDFYHQPSSALRRPGFLPEHFSYSLPGTNEMNWQGVTAFTTQHLRLVEVCRNIQGDVEDERWSSTRGALVSAVALTFFPLFLLL